MSGKKGNKQDFPNNFEKIRSIPDDYFETHEFDELMEWRAENWDLCSNIAYLIRVENASTGKRKEFAYQRPYAGRKKIAQLLQDKHNIVQFLTHEDSITGLTHKHRHLFAQHRFNDHC